MRAFALFRLQLRQRISGMAAWLAVWSLLSLLFAYVFNALGGKNSAAAATFRDLPRGILSAVNIDPSNYLSHVESFISGQFLFVYLLAGSIFAISIGIGAVGRRIQDRTIANLLTRPIPRGQLYLSLLVANSTALVIAGVALCIIQWNIFNALTDQPVISKAYFVCLHLGSTLLFVAMAAFGQLLGSLISGGRSLQIGAGFVIISYFMETLGGLANLPGWVQAASLFHYLDVARLRDTFTLDPVRTLVLVGAALIFALLGTLYFKHKNICM